MTSDSDHALPRSTIQPLGRCHWAWAMLAEVVSALADQRQPQLLSLFTLYQQLLSSLSARAVSHMCVCVLHKIHS